MSGQVQPRRALVVLGMHRSGTSAMTRLLSLSGAALPGTLMDSYLDNPVGFWESQAIADFDDELLRALGSSWDDINGLDVVEAAEGLGPAWVKRAARLLGDEYPDQPVIVLKDPRINLLLPMWQRAIAEAGFEPSYVLMVRNPLEVAASLHARDGFGQAKSLLLWATTMLAAERATRGTARCFVAYDELMRDWRGTLARIARDTGIALDQSDVDAAADAFLDDKQRHHRTGQAELQSDRHVPDPFKRLFAELEKACGDKGYDEAVADEALEYVAMRTGIRRDGVSLEGNEHDLPATARRDELAFEAEQQRMRADRAERELADIRQGLSQTEDEIDRAVRAIELRVERRLREMAHERDVLGHALGEERHRAAQFEAQLKSAKDEAARSRAAYADARAKLARFEQELEAIEDEMDLVIDRVERRAALLLKDRS